MARAAALWRRLRRLAGAVKRRAEIRLAPLAPSPSPWQILSSWPEGTAQLGPRVAVLMHFDRSGKVSDEVMAYARELALNEYSVAFVTNSGCLAPSAFAALRQHCAAIFVRRNIGYDFGAWRDVVDTLGLPRPGMTELLLLNDSMHGPLRPLQATLARLDYAAADIWGLTDSWQQRYHLQSYFLGFGETALRDPAFAAFWRNVLPVRSKSFVIRAYEVGLTQAMLKAGLRCRAVWRYEDLVDTATAQGVLDGIIRAGRFRAARHDPLLRVRKEQIDRIRGAAARQIAVNPTADLWRQLLHAGFPFVKRELLRKNPSRVADIADWVATLRAEGLDPEPVLNALRGRLKNRAP